MKFSERLGMMMEFSRLKTGFEQYFRVVPALTKELNEAAFKVRHQVYCEELGWEPARENGLETDEYDDHAFQCLLQNRYNGEFVGCIRIVLPRPYAYQGALPFETACRQGLYHNVPDPQLLDRRALGEVSRLAVLGRYRRRPHERNKAVHIDAEDFGDRTRPRFPYIPVGLYCGMLQMARRTGLEKLYLLTEPSLARHFRQLGGRLVPVGEPIEHRGKRVPYEIPVDDVIKHMNRFIKPLFNHIAEDVDATYRNPGRVA